MRYLLDTNICIYIAKHRPPAVRERFSGLRVGEAAMSVVTYLELVYGAWKSQRPTDTLANVERLRSLIPALPVEPEVASACARIRTELERAETPIGSLDTLIAAQALTLDLILVTNNTREFARVKGLRVENWAG